MNRHDIRFDTLRVISTYAVVWLHVSAPVVTNCHPIGTGVWWIGNAADAFSRWCVPIFVMMSGALLLSQSSESDPLGFYRRRAVKLLVPLLFWSLFYIGWTSYQEGQVDVYRAAKSVIAGYPYYHLWYLYMIIGLYAMTPFLSQLASGSSPRLMVLLIVLCFSMASIDSLLSPFKKASAVTFVGLWLPYVAYYLAGHYLYIVQRAVSKIFLLTAALGSAACLALGAGVLYTTLGSKSLEIMYANLNPLVIIMSLAIYQFAVCSKGKPSDTGSRVTAAIQFMAPLTLGIYVIHPFWIDVLNHAGISGFTLHPSVGIIVTSLLAFGLSLISTIILRSIPSVSGIV
jgi:surface polysaccharide O-acyltransferase-like enzyme